MTNTNERKKTAVILSGGGANGAFEVGVMKALFNGKSPATNKKPLDPDIYSGSSVGGYNASFLVSRSAVGSTVAIAELEDIWVNRIAENAKQCGNGVYRFRGDPLEFLSPECLINHPLRPFVQLTGDSIFLAQDAFRRAINFAVSPASLQHRALDLFALTSFVSVEPFKQTIRETIDLAAIRQSDKVAKVATTNWETGRVNIYENSDMTDDRGRHIIRGSAAIPGFFPPVPIDGQLHVDGGVLMTTPLSPAIGAGADTLHIIFLDPKVENIPIERLQSTLDVISRFYDIWTASQFRADIAKAAAISRGLEVIARSPSGVTPSNEETQAFLQVAEQMHGHVTKSRRYKKLTVHIYAPKDDLGGVLGLLNFNRDREINLIERGFKQAVEHDCEASGCVLPSQTEPDETGDV